jgi:uncharacterized membrane protein
VSRLVYAIVVGLVGAGIVHIAILVMLPYFSERDIWSRLAASSELYAAVTLDTELDGVPTARPIDPLMRVLACRFDLAEGPVRVHAEGPVPFWSASVFNRAGENIYSLNDRTQSTAGMDMTILTADQLIDLRKDMPTELERSVFIEVGIDEGIFVARVFTPDPSWARVIDRFVQGLRCSLV